MSLDMITDKADRTSDGNQGHISSPSIGKLWLHVGMGLTNARRHVVARCDGRQGLEQVDSTRQF